MTISKNTSESIVSHFSSGRPGLFTKGDILVQGDTEPAGVLFIRHGYVKAYSISKLGQQNLLLIQGPDEILPLPWALDGAQKLGIFYEAMSGVKVLRTSKHSLREAMGTNSWLTEQIMRQLVNTFTVYAQRIQSLGYRLPRERVIACLLDLSARFGESHGQGSVIQAPVTHLEIADSINMSRETASRALEQLFKDGLVSQDNHLFAIINEEKLQAELS